MVNASPLLTGAFVILAAGVAAMFVIAVLVASVRHGQPVSRARRSAAIAGLGALAWLGLTLTLAATGRLSFTSRPPTVGIVMVAGLIIALAVSLSPLGRRIATGVPLAALVASQAFRFPLELTMHRAYVEGLMPVQMSYSGFNLDILTGLFAIVVSLVVVRNPRSLVVVRIWNTAGVVLLANVVTIALLSTPTPIRVFHNEPANEWIAHAPWVWLPTVFVVGAIVGHVLVFRRLRFELQGGAERGVETVAPRPARFSGAEPV